MVFFVIIFAFLLLMSSLVLLRNPHLTKARYRLAQSLDGQGKTAEAFTEVTSLLRVNPEVIGFMADTVYNCQLCKVILPHTMN